MKKLMDAYVAGKLELDTFQEWFAAFYVSSVNGEEENTDLDAVRNIALSLAEFTSGDISESDLKADIRRYAGLSQPVTVVLTDAPVMQTSPAAVTTERRVAFG